MILSNKVSYFLILAIISLSTLARADDSFNPDILKPFEELSLGLLPRGENECLLEEPPILKKERDSKSLASGKMFFDLQFFAVNERGNTSFQQMPIPILNLGQFLTEHAKVKGLKREDLLKLSDTDLTTLLNSDWVSPFSGIEKQHAIENALLIKKLSAIQDIDVFYQTLSTEMKPQSFARKVGLLSNLLSYMLDNYDLTTTSKGSSRDLKISDMDILKAMNQSIKTGNIIEAGVCRHMHQFAIRMARAMGLENAYTVGFRTDDGGHRTMVLQDPGDRSRVIQLNYGDVFEKVGVTGPEALTQNHNTPNTGINLRVYNHKDELAIILPTEEGAIFHRMSGGRDPDLSPDYRSRAQIQQVGVDTPMGTVRLFHSSSSNDTKTDVTGVGANKTLRYNDLFSGEYGVLGFTSSRLVGEGELKNKGLYFRTSQNMNVRVYESPDLSIDAFTRMQFNGTVYCNNIDNEDCLVNQEIYVGSISGVEATYQTGPVRSKTSAIVQGQFDEDQSEPGISYVFETPVTQLTHDSTFPISSTIQGSVGGELNLYHLGPGIHGTYNGRLGVRERKRKIQFKLSLDGRLTESTPVWIPDSEQALGGNLGTTFYQDQLYLNLEGRKSLEIDGSYFLGIGVGGSFTPTQSD